MNKIQIIELLRTHHSELSSRQAEIFIEMAAYRIAEETNAYKRSLVFSSIAGQRWYNFSHQIIEIDSVYFNDVKIPKLVGDPVIDDDEFGTNAEDTADTELATPIANASNKRFWIYSPYKKYAEAGTTASRALEGTAPARIGIVEKVANSVTRDGRTSDYQSCSITGTNNVRVLGSFFPEPFQQTAAGTDTDQEDATLETSGPLAAIPKQHHEALVTGAIAIAYKYPPNIDLNMAAAFENEFGLAIKKIKKHSRTRISTGFIKPHDF